MRHPALTQKNPRQRPGRGHQAKQTAMCSWTAREPQTRIELVTARLRIGCSTAELLWRTSTAMARSCTNHLACTIQLHERQTAKRHQHALARTRTATPFSTTTSKWRVYQFHHQSVRLTWSCGTACHTCHANHAQQNRSYGTALRLAPHQLAGPNRPFYYGSDGARTRDLSSDSRVL